MRNPFDQYSQPENRVTHALLTCLEQDRKLLERFIHWAVGRKVRGGQLQILEQSLPGDPSTVSEAEADRRGLPDGCIADQLGWALILESKFQASISAEQIQRHVRTAARRGLTDCDVLVLTVKPSHTRLPLRTTVRSWSEVYRWLSEQAPQSRWARICREYLEVAEARGISEDYLLEGKLTEFSGIPFGKAESYTYLQAKRLLKLLREEVVKDRRLASDLGADPQSTGRGAITGSKGTLVWDFVALKSARGAKTFTKFPHLTFGIRPDRLEAYITVPNGVRSQARWALLGQGFEHFESLVKESTMRMLPLLKQVPACQPMVVAVQRHYPSQRSQAVIDCSLKLDPRTAIGVREGARGGVKHQPQWLRAAYDALRSRSSNLQLQMGVDFPYESCPVVHTAEIVGVVADVWLACQPLLREVTT